MCDIHTHHCANPACTATRHTLKTHCLSNKRAAKKLHGSPLVCQKHLCLFFPPEKGSPPWTCGKCREREMEVLRRKREGERKEREEEKVEVWREMRAEELRRRFEEGLREADGALEVVKVKRVMDVRAVLNE